MTNFDKYILELENEVNALKTIRRKSATILTTITKRIDTSASIAWQNYPTNETIRCWDAVLIRLEFVSNKDALYSVSFPPYSQNGRPIQPLNWIDTDGTPAILAIPFRARTDDSIIWGGYDIPRTVNFSLFITATDDFQYSTRLVEYSHGNHY